MHRYTYVAERRAHDNCFVAVLLIIVEDALNGLDTGVLITLVILTGVLLVPVKDLRHAV